MMQDIETLMKELNTNFKEREDEIAGAMLALMSGEHVLLLGPPGTAKSLLARIVCGCVEDGNFYYYLLTRFTTPEEVFGAEVHATPILRPRVSPCFSRMVSRSARIWHGW